LTHVSPDFRTTVGILVIYSKLAEKPSFFDQEEVGDGVNDLPGYHDLDLTYALVPLLREADKCRDSFEPEQLAADADSAQRKDQGAIQDPPLPP
jgi:hypothetical protein